MTTYGQVDATLATMTRCSRGWTGVALICLRFTASLTPQRRSFVLPESDGKGHVLHVIDPLGSTSDTQPLSPHAPTFALEYPENGAIIRTSSTLARFKIVLPYGQRGAFGRGDATLCLTVRGANEADEPEQPPDFHTCLEIKLPSSTNDTDAGVFKELEAVYPVPFPHEGWFRFELELRPGGEVPVHASSLVYACPSLDGAVGTLEDSIEYFGLDMSVGGTFGWGVAGANIARAMLDNFARSRNSTVDMGNDAFPRPRLPVPLRGIDGATLSTSTRRALEPALHAAARVRAQVEAVLDREESQSGEAHWVVPLPFPIVHGIGGPSTVTVRQGVEYWGTVNIAILFLENTTLPHDYLAFLDRYDVVLAGSQWLHDLLASRGVPREKLGVFWQCVDGQTFHPPSPPVTVDPQRFNIFSGGKLEFRKAQDIVAAAMRTFLPRHPHARLLLAWHNPWHQHLRTIERSPHTKGWPTVKLGGGNDADFREWLAENGVNVSQVVDLGRLERSELAELLRSSVDVGIFPNRAEGGTNLIAMEGSASGVPLILSRATGQGDLVGLLGGEHNAYFLTPYRAPRETEGEEGWAESSVQEIIDRLEEVMRDREEAKERGKRASRHLLETCTWERSVAEMLSRTASIETVALKSQQCQ